MLSRFCIYKLPIYQNINAGKLIEAFQHSFINF